MDGERKPQRQPRAHQPRRLRDISHLYLSSRTAPASRAAGVAPRRSLRLGFLGAGQGRGRAEICANMAVQLARLGQRTLVLDLDPRLPNVGFFLGLSPEAYMSHLFGAGARMERALLGLRLVEGAAQHPSRGLPEEHLREIQGSDCVLVNLPEAPGEVGEWLGTLEALLRDARTTTMVEAAARSPMFGTWLESARRQGREAESVAAPRPHAFDAFLYVHEREGSGSIQACMSQLARWLPSNRLRLMIWGTAQPPAGMHPWAWIRHDERQRAPGLLSSVFPEHPMSRTYQGLVQALLAGAVNAGGAHV